METVSMQNVTKKYRSFTVLDGIDLAVRENVITGLVGRNGAGKTTMMKLIAGYMKETSGELLVFGERPFNSLKVSANLIFVDDRMKFPDGLKLEDILAECRRFYENWNEQLAQRLLDYFSLPLFLRHRTLSKGKRSIFNAVIGIAARCPLTIFDEPITGMDAAARRDFYRALLKDYMAHPRSIIVSSHHMEEMEDLLEDIIVLDGRHIRFHGPVTKLQEQFVQLTGKEQLLKQYAAAQAAVHRSSSPLQSEWIVDNGFNDSELVQMKEAGIRVSPLSASEAYIALTGQAKGGVDDVFNAMERS